MRNIIRVTPRSPPPALEKCPHCGSPEVELRTDGATLCKKCFYTTKPRVNASLLQQWSGSIFSLAPKTATPRDLVLGGRIAGLGGALLLLAVVVAFVPLGLPREVMVLLAPTAPSELALLGGMTVVGILALLGLFAGYTMSHGDEKAWRAAVPVGLVALLLGILGPGGLIGVLAGGLVVLGGILGRAA